MSLYQTLAQIGPRFVGKANMFRFGFNLSPMYSRSTGKITEVTEDLHKVTMKLPISYKNRNYVGSIFGGSMFSAVDPIPMVQLINLLDSEFVVWDKSAEIFFKAPAKEDLYGDFEYTESELADIRERVKQQNEIEIVKTTQLTDAARTKVFCEVRKTLYISTKAHYKAKRKQREAEKEKVAS